MAHTWWWNTWNSTVAKSAQAHRPQLWLGVNNRGPMTANGIYQMIARRGRRVVVAVELAEVVTGSAAQRGPGGAPADRRHGPYPGGKSTRAPAKGDRRFADPAWSQNPAFRRLVPRRLWSVGIGDLSARRLSSSPEPFRP